VCERFVGGASGKACPTGYGCLKAVFKNRLSLLRPSPPCRGTLWRLQALRAKTTKLIARQASRLELQARCRIGASQRQRGCNPCIGGFQLSGELLSFSKTGLGTQNALPAPR